MTALSPGVVVGLSFGSTKREMANIVCPTMLWNTESVDIVVVHVGTLGQVYPHDGRTRYRWTYMNAKLIMYE